MTNSKFIFDKLSKIFEEGLVNYRDFSNEILNILKSKRDEIVFKMKLTSKEEADIINQRVNSLEKKIEKIEKQLKKNKVKKVKKS